MSAEDRRRITDLHERGATQREIAELFNVSQPTISRVLDAARSTESAIQVDSPDGDDLAAWARAQPNVLRAWMAAESAYRKALATDGDFWPLRERHGKVIAALSAEQRRRRELESARNGLPVIG